jgi:serine/threonine protein phosphatase 1
MEIRGAPGHLPRGRRIYAIGDIHGSLPQLRDLHAQIAEDLRRRPVASAMLIHLGDYVDKGPDSRGVVDYLSVGDPIPGLPTLHLMGNHEETMLGGRWRGGSGLALGRGQGDARFLGGGARCAA